MTGSSIYAVDTDYGLETKTDGSDGKDIGELRDERGNRLVTQTPRRESKETRAGTTKLLVVPIPKAITSFLAWNIRF
jgi:hypothetical protein